MNLTAERTDYDLRFNYTAFLLAIESPAPLTPEKAIIFIFGEGEGTRQKVADGAQNRKWTVDDALEIDRLRSEGKRWNDDNWVSYDDLMINPVDRELRDILKGGPADA